jgi:calpain-15
MEENGIDPADIQQGNIGDCYFLASISALAENPQRIQNIFLDNFVVNGNCIYKVVACVDGVMAEVVIDDFVPVYASTSRPVFCKANGREIWVMLLEKAWAKIKGSYGAISAGTPHEVLNTFCLAPCFNFQIQSSNAEEYKDAVWAELLDASALDLPTCASTREEVLLEGLKPLHTYTVLSCANVPVGGINYRMMRLRNPWGDTEYSGFASESDSKFWSQVPKEIKAQMLPGESANDGDFVIPFSEFIKHFESIDTCHFRPQFSYEFETLKMARGQPTFVRLVVKEDHEAYLTLEKVYAGEDAQEELRHAGYGYSRMLIAREAGNQNFEYFSSKLETNFGDLSLRCNFQAGTYVIMVEADYPGGIPKFNAIFSYYYQGLQARESKTISVQSYDASVFLHQVLLNHAHRMSADVSKLSSRPEDWVKSTLLYEQGGYGYVACSLQKEANFRLHISIDEKYFSPHAAPSSRTGSNWSRRLPRRSMSRPGR